MRKVDVFANIINRTIQGTLKVKSKWKDIYGISPQGIYEYGSHCWWIQLLVTIGLLFLGAIIGHMLG